MHAIERGESSASDQLLPLVYNELRNLAAAKLKNESKNKSIQPTMLVHEAYVRLVDVEDEQKWNGKGHFFGAAAAMKAIKQFVVDRPESPFGYIVWADMLVYEADEDGKYPDAGKAVELAQQAVDLTPNHSKSLATLGIAQYRASNAESAIVSLEKAVQLGFRHPLAWLHLSLVHSDLDDAERAKKRFEQSQKWMGNNHVLIPQLAKLSKEAKRELERTSK